MDGMIMANDQRIQDAQKYLRFANDADSYNRQLRYKTLETLRLDLV
jgi:hypothetical protein